MGHFHEFAYREFDRLAGRDRAPAERLCAISLPAGMASGAVGPPMFPEWALPATAAGLFAAAGIHGPAGTASLWAPAGAATRVFAAARGSAAIVS
jgi:hypothetical protein